MGKGGSGSRGKGGGGGGSEQTNTQLADLKSNEQITLSDGMVITKIDNNTFLIGETNSVIVNKPDLVTFLDGFNKSAVAKPVESIKGISADKALGNNKAIVNSKQLKLEPTNLKMGEIVNTIDKKGFINSGSAEIVKINSKTYITTHPDFETPRIMGKSELRSFIRSNENDFDGFRKVS